MLLIVTGLATLGVENGPNGIWLFNEEKIMLLMVSINVPSSWQSQAGCKDKLVSM